MSKIIKYLPELQGEEQLAVAQLVTDMTDEQAEQFSHVYRSRRKDPTMTLMMALLGFIVISGVHRFYLGQVGMGLAYLFTAGFCFIGTIVDLFNYRALTDTYNENQALQVSTLIRGSFPESE